MPIKGKKITLFTNTNVTVKPKKIKNNIIASSSTDNDRTKQCYNDRIKQCYDIIFDFIKPFEKKAIKYEDGLPQLSLGYIEKCNDSVSIKNIFVNKYISSDFFLNYDILILMCQYLSFKELLNLACTCKSMYFVVTRNDFMKKYLKKEIIKKIAVVNDYTMYNMLNNTTYNKHRENNSNSIQKPFTKKMQQYYFCRQDEEIDRFIDCEEYYYDKYDGYGSEYDEKYCDKYDIKDCDNDVNYFDDYNSDEMDKEYEEFMKSDMN